MCMQVNKITCIIYTINKMMHDYHYVTAATVVLVFNSKRRQTC